MMPLPDVIQVMSNVNAMDTEVDGFIAGRVYAAEQKLLADNSVNQEHKV